MNMWIGPVLTLDWRIGDGLISDWIERRWSGLIGFALVQTREVSLALNRPPARPVVYPHSTLVPRLDTGLSSGLTQDRCDIVNSCRCVATIICSVDCRIAVLTDRRQINCVVN